MSRRTGPQFTLNELVVLSLLNGCEEMYGMEIVKAAAARTSASQASVGTIYPLLKDLVRDGWLSSRQAAGIPRVYYRLTEYGRGQLPLIAAQLEHVNDSMSALLALATGQESPAAPSQPH